MDEDDPFECEGEETVVRWFTASYRSDCARCGALIGLDDSAGYIGEDDEASCEECCTHPAQLA